jgi:hypothetical protein
MYPHVTRYSESPYGQKRPLWTSMLQPLARASIGAKSPFHSLTLDPRFRRNRATVGNIFQRWPKKTDLFVLHLAFLHPFVLLHLLFPHLLKLGLLLGREYSVNLVM